MVQRNLNLGGEQSGHMIFRDFTTTGDGIVSALQILRIMKSTGGREIVFVVGAGVIVGGLAMVVRAFQQKFEDKLDMRRMPSSLRSATSPIGTAGIAARGLVFALIGGFLVDAAVRFQPAKAKGLDASLKTVAHQPFGRILLFVGALGLLAFSLWSFIEARYRKI